MDRKNAHRVGRRMMAGLAVAALLAACSSTSKTSTGGGSTTAGSTGGTDKPLLIARGMDVNSLDPSRAYCDTCQIYLTAVYETLIGLAPDNKTLEPRLALSWTGNDDQTQFTFKLDPKAKFADGTQVTSADVKYSWERLGGLKGSASYLVGQIKSIETPDPETVVANMTTSNSAFLAQVNASYLGVINSKVAQAQNATADPATDKAEPWFLKNSAGSGPFVLESYTQGTELRLKRNDAYWGAKPAFPEVVIKETPTAVTQRQQLESGTVDLAMQISTDVAKDMKSGNVTVTKVPSFNYVYLALSPGATGGDKLTPDVLKAIKLALDYKGLVDVTVGGAGQPQPSPIPNGFLGTDGLAAPAQDVAAAKDLLTKAGATGLSFDATYPTFNVYGVDFTTAMQKVQTDLKAVGIDIKLNPVEISVWVDKISKDGIPVTMLYFAPDHTDPSQYVQYFGLLPDSQWQTWTKVKANDNEVSLLTKALGTKDEGARGAVYKELAQAMIDDGVIIPVVNPDLYLASRSDIKGNHYSACCNLVLSRLSRG